MYFEHVIQVNDLNNPMATTLSRQVGQKILRPLGAAHQASTLTISIEEPEPLSLFVRFVYQSTLPEHTPPGSEVDYVAYLKSAYQQMDTEAIATLRQLAEAGELD